MGTAGTKEWKGMAGGNGDNNKREEFLAMESDEYVTQCVWRDGRPRGGGGIQLKQKGWHAAAIARVAP